MQLLAQLSDQLAVGGVVLVPIIFTGLVMWWLIISKFLLLIQFRKHEKTSVEFTKSPPPKWHWQYKLVDNYAKLRCSDDEINHSVMATLSTTCCDEMAKGISTIALLAAAAPLMGLLGTVTGMIATFSTIAEFGTGNARGLAEGISQALITTQAGLLVAIPGYVAVNILQRRITKLQNRVNEYLTYIDVELLQNIKGNIAQQTKKLFGDSAHV